MVLNMVSVVVSGKQIKFILVFFFFSSRRRHTRCYRDWSSDVCSSDARVLATDVSEAAVRLASANAERHGLEVEVLTGVILSPVPEALRGTVAQIVSNPPYIAPEDYEGLPEEVRAEPYEALVGGTEFHSRLADKAPGWLEPGGWLVVEIGADQGEEVHAIFSGRLDEVAVLP